MLKQSKSIQVCILERTLSQAKTFGLWIFYLLKSSSLFSSNSDVFISMWKTFGNHCNEMFIPSMVINVYNL
jgi:hypothetical protein